MGTLIQIILVNLLVSCDNVGVIALATRNLPTRQALTARRVGVGLSIVLKLIFVIITSFLLGVPWLHIRIVGGALLLYVTFNMLRQHTPEQANKTMSEQDKSDNFVLVILSILAADVSMSLDNVIAVLGIVSADGHALGLTEMFIVFLGFLICIPVLLLFSGTVARVMKRFPIFSYLCAGYLIYTAVNMVFEDETIRLFFERIHFTFTTPAAILCGVLIVLYGLEATPVGLKGMREKKTPNHNRTLFVYCAITLYSLVSVIVISYLNTNPIVEGQMLSVETLYGFTPSGANAVYIISSSSGLFALCAIALSGAQSEKTSATSYIAILLANMKKMFVFILLELIVCSVGLSFMFGVGAFSLPSFLSAFIMQTLLLLTYPAVFCMLSEVTKSKVVFVIWGMLYVLVEALCAAIFMTSRSLSFLAGLFPSYYIDLVNERGDSGAMVLRILVTSLLYISAATFIGYSRHTKNNKRAFIV